MRGHNNNNDRINSMLPDELLMEIFRHVESKSSRDACALVCRRWRTLERLSRDTIRIGGSGSPDSLVNLIATRFLNVTNLFIDERVSGAHPFDQGRRGSVRHQPTWLRLHLMADRYEPYCLLDAGLAAVADGFTKLQKLTLIWCSNATNAGLTFVAQKCTSLKCLDLQGCYVGDQGLRAIGKYCKQLEVLNLRFCEGLTDIGLVDLAIGCEKSLKSLGVAACAKITDVSLEAVGSHCRVLETLSLDSEYVNNKRVIIAVANGCPLLKNLNLQCIMVTDEALTAVGRLCVLLESLALLSFQRFSDKSLCAIGKGCKKLKSLMLSDCYFLSDKGLEAVAAGCPELSLLEINGCHNISTYGLETIGRFCMRLRELALLYCQKVGNEALYEVGKGCKYLQALHLVDCSVVGDDAICSIAIGCKNLKKLHIRRCYVVESKGAIGDNGKYLTDLSIRFCDRVGDEALVAIGNGCPLLCHLNVSGCYQIGDTGITAIARGCPQLTYLDVSVLQNLGDMALAEVGEGCPLLKDIILSHCREITDFGLAHLVKRCKWLESCYMVYCPGVTAAGVATVISTCVNIKKVLIEKSKVSARTRRRAGSVISYLCVDL
ncbi:uncharacterized protein LOC143633334 [Bidens hawaiensis]|uniref:uncharacterized protein LOC143633334 n=1 Tax=Bidens hawaiensis TaxID=980011 RepID=UPI00404AFFB8